MKCPKCGKYIPDYSKFCLECGGKIEIEKEINEKESESVIKKIDANEESEESSEIRENVSTNGSVLGIALILVAIIVIFAVIKGTIDNKKEEKARADRLEEMYQQLVEYVDEGDFNNAKRVIANFPEYNEYKDVADIIKRMESEEERIKEDKRIQLEKEKEEEYKRKYDQLVKDYNDLDSMTIERVSNMRSDVILLENMYDLGDMPTKISSKLADMYYDEKQPEKALAQYDIALDYLTDDQKEKREQCAKYCKFIGDWIATYSDGYRLCKFKEDGATITLVLTTDGGATKESKVECSIYANISRMDEGGVLKAGSSNGAVEIRLSDGNKLKVKTKSKDITFVKDSENKGEKVTIVNAIKKPRIGMTKEEVIATEWGRPDDINKTTYEWGVTEQWCYPNYKYVYFEDGIVTTIQE